MPNDIDFTEPLKEGRKQTVSYLRRCGNCIYAVAQNPLDLKNTVLQCRYNPPTVMAIIGPMTPQGPSIKIDGYHPPVGRDHFCYKFESKLNNN